MVHVYCYSFGGGNVLTDGRLFDLTANGHCGIMCCWLLLSFKAKAVLFQEVIHLNYYVIHIVIILIIM